jgi:salicylate hydroxylase
MPLGAAAEARYGAPYVQIHRADLLEAVREAAAAAGAEIRLEAEVERAGDTRGGAALYTSAGAVEADMVVAADGVRSVLRREMTRARPRFAGHVAHRGLVEADRLPEALRALRGTVWMGPRRHLVTYPLRGRRLVNFVAVVEEDEWTAEGWREPGDPEALRAEFADWHGEVRSLLGAVTETFRWGLFGHPELPRWSQGRVVLLGDAAHPTLPFLAQGAGMALEDAVVLARALERHAPEEALAAYEAARKPRATRLQKAAARNGWRFHSRSAPERWAKAGAIAALGRFAPKVAEGLNDWVYDYDPATAKV